MQQVVDRTIKYADLKAMTHMPAHYFVEKGVLTQLWRDVGDIDFVFEVSRACPEISPDDCLRLLRYVKEGYQHINNQLNFN